MGVISGQRTKILHGTLCGQNIKNKKQQLSPCLIPQWGHHRKGPPDWVPFSGILFINGPHVPAPDLGTRDRERKRSCR